MEAHGAIGEPVNLFQVQTPLIEDTQHDPATFRAQIARNIKTGGRHDAVISKPTSMRKAAYSLRTEASMLAVLQIDVARTVDP